MSSPAANQSATGVTTRARRLAIALAVCSLAALVAVWITLDWLGDRQWWTVAILFGPRWLLAAPWVGCVPWLLIDFRRAIIPALAGIAMAAFPIMGTQLGLHRASIADGVPFRVLELNADGGSSVRQQTEITAELRSRNPDLMIVAECGPELGQALERVVEYQFRRNTSLCMLSRSAVIEWASRDAHDVWVQGGSGAIVRAIVATAAGPVRIGLVHLATPRQALDAYFDLSELPKQGPNTRANMAQRDEESGLARAWILTGPALPTIVGGDFNLPVESAIYRRYWSDFRNAFGRAGLGTGYTKHTRRWGVRIDHVLTSDDIGAHDSFIGRGVGSDHLPLIADLVLPRPQRTTTAR